MDISLKNKSERFQILHRLFWLRNLAIMVQLLVIISVMGLLDIALPFEALMVVVSIETLFNLFMAWRLKNRFPVTETEIVFNLAFDALILGALLYYSGGSTNPFVSLFLVPIALAASFISMGYVISIAILCILLYSFLMLNHYSLPSAHGRFGGDFNLHVIGMWINFILSTIVVVIFITELAKQARRHTHKLAENEKELMRNEYIVSLGTLAAGTAHEISTPLSNIGMMADELVANPADKALVRDFAQTIKEQQQHCVNQLHLLRSTSDQQQDELSDAGSAHDLLDGILDRWSPMRPEIRIRRKFTLQDSADIIIPPTISHAIINLLNNAADASLENHHSDIIVYAAVKDNRLIIDIDDFGKGFNDEQINLAGNIAFSTKKQGLGVGLMLSHASLARYDGKITIHRRDDGVRSTLCIPIDNIQA
ncbi:MAG: HAMP domain-containing histidine kinase [Gammaproteobacteria bacterium]|nr:HAMP domain-containing histidine kinase [Gammaproteobacteria bacterium]